ncbi:UNVERIFIED_CONTAM: hypothetical protein NY603_31305, partial [Bacteroidetes bacterium 56_B9]
YLPGWSLVGNQRQKIAASPSLANCKSDRVDLEFIAPQMLLLYEMLIACSQALSIKRLVAAPRR